MQLITTIARLFLEIFCGLKNRDMQRFFVVAMHGNATALSRRKIRPPRAAACSDPGIAQAVCKRTQEIRAAIGYIRAVRGELQEEPPLFHFQQRQRNSVG